MQQSGDPWLLGRRRALDGVRGVACLLVLVSHLVVSETPAFLAGGGAGVTMFFTLSGFLITALLLQERERDGRIRLGAFYVRRARRLLPALVVCLVVTLLLAPLVGDWFADLGGALRSLFYVSNWAMLDGATLGALSHTWSLSIEEQFYLVWPLLLILLRRCDERVLLGVTLVGIATSVGLTLALWDDGVGVTRVYFGSDTRANAILAGCAAAIIARRLGAGVGRPRTATALVLLALPIGFVHTLELVFVVAPLAVAGLTATALILGTRGEWTGVLTHPVLCWVGQRSYGLYLWHYVAVTALAGLMPWLAWAPIYVVATLAATTLSWRFVEQPFLTGRPRTTGARHRAAVPASGSHDDRTTRPVGSAASRSDIPSSSQ